MNANQSVSRGKDHRVRVIIANNIIESFYANSIQEAFLIFCLSRLAHLHLVSNGLNPVSYSIHSFLSFKNRSKWGSEYIREKSCASFYLLSFPSPLLLVVPSSSSNQSHPDLSFRKELLNNMQSWILFLLPFPVPSYSSKHQALTQSNFYTF